MADIANCDTPTVDHALPHRLVEDVWCGPVEAAFDAVDRLIAWAEAQRVRLVAALRDAGRSPLELLDRHSVHQTTASVGRAERRTDLLTAFPTFADALACG